MRQSRSGFTLIELIFVIVIIGLLAAVAVPRFLTTEANAKIKPALEVADQVVNKVTERYQQIQDAHIYDAVTQDKDIMKYLDRLTVDVDKHFQWDTNETQFEIAYNPGKLCVGDYKKDCSTKITIDDGGDASEPEGDGAAVCVKVNRWAIQVPVTVDANTTQYDFNVSEVNVSCITAAH